MSETKTKSIENINKYLEAYSEEQLELLHNIIKVFSNTIISKDDIAKLSFTEEETKNQDSALPHHYVEIVKEVYPGFNSFNYVFDYNENSHGKLVNISEKLVNKMATVLNHSHFTTL